MVWSLVLGLAFALLAVSVSAEKQCMAPPSEGGPKDQGAQKLGKQEDGTFMVLFENSVPQTKISLFFDDSKSGHLIADIDANSGRHVSTYLGHTFYAKKFGEDERIGSNVVIKETKTIYKMGVADETEDDLVSGTVSSTSSREGSIVKEEERETVDSDGVLIIYDDNYDSILSSNDALLVEYYAPWCGHCKQLAPEWAKAAKLLATEKIPAKLAKCDATAEKGVSAKVDIKGFPTLKYFKSGKVSEYTGGRTAAEIVAWIKKQTGPPTKSLVTIAELLNAERNNDVVVLGVFNSVSSPALKVFTAAAKEDTSTLFYGTTTSGSIKSKLQVKSGDEVVIILKNFDEGRADLIIDDKFDSKALSEFIKDKSLPLVHTFTTENSRKIFDSGIKVHSLFFTEPEEDHHGQLFEVFTDFAKEYKGRMIFVNVPSGETSVMEYFGVKKEKLPQFAIVNMTDTAQIKKYMLSGELTHAAISSQLIDFFDLKLTPTLKSEDPEPEDTNGAVVVLRGSSFADLVLNNDKDVFVEFYAPWCGHCKNLAPEWDKLGEHFKNNDKIVIAKIDATANEVDVPGVTMAGYPTIYFFKGTDKASPIKFSDFQAKSDVLIEYVEKMAYNLLNSADKEEGDSSSNGNDEL